MDLKFKLYNPLTQSSVNKCPAANHRKFKLRHCQQVEELDLSVQAGAFVFINSER